MFYKARNSAIKFYDDYSSMISEAKDEATKGKRLIILSGGTNPVSDIQDYFGYILTKHGEKVRNSSIKIYLKILKIELDLKLKQDIILSF